MPTITPNRSEFVEAVKSVLLAAPFNLERVDSVSDEKDAKGKVTKRGLAGASSQSRTLWLGEKAPVRFRVERELDVEADAVIADHALGSIGLLHWLGTPSKDGKTGDDVRNALDRAAYLRHLLVQSAARETTANTVRSPYSVEVVFVLPAKSPEQETASELGAELHKILQGSAHVHALGVNLWQLRDISDVLNSRSTPRDTRRAFSWLLVNVREWLAAEAKKSGADGFRKLTRLTLTNLRMPRDRVWTLEETGDGKRAAMPRMHLMHGFNGSGKTSFGEALELLVGGSVHRISSAPVQKHRDHREVLRCRRVEDEASITPEFDGPDKDGAKRTVVASGIEPPLLKGFPAHAFRMHQALGDELVQSNPARRAEILLSAFFPNEAGQLEKQSGARQRLDKALKGLSPQWASRLIGTTTKLDANRVFNELSWLASPFNGKTESSLPWGKILGLLPLSAVTLESLAPLLDAEFISLLKRTEPVDFSALLSSGSVFDRGIQTLQTISTRLAEVLPKARDILNAFNLPLARDSSRGEAELPVLLNDWLELVALADMLDQEQRALETIAAARAGKYEFPVNDEPILAVGQRPDPSRRAAVLKRVQLRLQETRDALDITRDKGAGPAKSGALPDLGAMNLDLLDEAARQGVFGSTFIQTDLLLSAAMREAVQRRRIVQLTRNGQPILSVGTPDWAKPLLANLDAVTAALRDAASGNTELAAASNQFSQLLPKLRQAADAARDVLSADAEVEQRFVARIGPGGSLAPALNELLALMTTARWGYEDVVTGTGVKSSSQEITLETGGLPSSLRLNTAELNLLALSLFLLCSPANPNPLRMIVLDDPLQNMDELTVTTVARALGRLLRLWDNLDPLEGWRLVILLHGEENIERLRREIPCVAHFLPWLSPGVDSAKNANCYKVEREDSRLDVGLQAVDRALTATPA